MESPQAFEGIFLDSVDLVFMETQLKDVRRQVCRYLGQYVVGEVQQPQMVHVSEGFGVNLGDLVVYQKQTLFGEERKGSEWFHLQLQQVKLMLDIYSNIFLLLMIF